MNKAYIVVPLAVAVIFLIFPFVIYYENDIMVVTSDSMIPTLMPHDLIIVQKTMVEEVQVGDIIAFDSHIEGMGIVVHRTIEKLGSEGTIGFSTQGDNVSEPDTWTVHDEDFIGKIIGVIPIIGIFLIDPVRNSLVAVIIIASLSLLKEYLSEEKIQNKK